MSHHMLAYIDPCHQPCEQRVGLLELSGELLQGPGLQRQASVALLVVLLHGEAQSCCCLARGSPHLSPVGGLPTRCAVSRTSGSAAGAGDHAPEMHSKRSGGCESIKRSASPSYVVEAGTWWMIIKLHKRPRLWKKFLPMHVPCPLITDLCNRKGQNMCQTWD